MTGVAQWIESCPAHRKIAGSIPSQGTCLGCEFGPLLEHMQETAKVSLLIDVSLPVFLPLFLSL